MKERVCGRGAWRWGWGAGGKPQTAGVESSALNEELIDSIPHPPVMRQKLSHGGGATESQNEVRSAPSSLWP